MKELLSHIRTCLGDCKNLDFSICLEKTPYLIIRDSIFYVFDDNKEKERPVRVVGEFDDFQLTVVNSSERDGEICLIKNDSCLVITREEKKCDCIIFNKEKLYFIEITEAHNRKAKRRKAVKQLGATIKHFNDRNVDLSEMHLTAIICFKHEAQTRIPNIGFKRRKDDFEETYKIDLVEVNSITF